MGQMSCKEMEDFLEGLEEGEEISIILEDGTPVVDLKVCCIKRRISALVFGKTPNACIERKDGAWVFIERGENTKIIGRVKRVGSRTHPAHPVEA